MTGPLLKAPTRVLTDHEVAIATALGRGERIVDIAARLKVTNGTVSNIVRRICAKTDLYATRQVAEYARNQGWCE